MQPPPACATSLPTSRRAAKKARRKLKREEQRRLALETYLAETAQEGSVTTGTPLDTAASTNTGGDGDVGGKAARMRLARRQWTNSSGNSEGTATTTTTAAAAWASHRPQGGPPLLAQTLPQHLAVTRYLEEVERQMRLRGSIKRRKEPMTERAEVAVDCHGTMDWQDDDDDELTAFRVHNNSENGDEPLIHRIDLSRSNLRGVLSLRSLPPKLIVDANDDDVTRNIQHRLNLSRNELWDVSFLLHSSGSFASTLTHLDLSRNWFTDLPHNLLTRLPQLTVLKASHNLLRPTTILHSLTLSTIKDSTAPKQQHCLQLLDLRFNQKCNKPLLLEALQSHLGEQVEVKMTVTVPPSNAAAAPSPASDAEPPDRIGASPAERNAGLLRSQLEPWSTMALRRRLVADFGEERMATGGNDDVAEECQSAGTRRKSWADPTVTRGQVMGRLLDLYGKEECKLESEENGNGTTRYNYKHGRAIVRVAGIPVDASIRNRVLAALKELWDSTSAVGSNSSNPVVNANRERPSIRATNYMILCSPSMFELGSKKAAKAAIKLRKHQRIWDLAREAMESVDPAFASRYTAVAVTHNFVGSPHIDKQNIGPFYGLALGDFEEGTGGVCVECSARVVAVVNTKNRMGKVDGRYPHWVAPYDVSKGERYSLIYYRTEGEPEPIGPAIFELPTCG